MDNEMDYMVSDTGETERLRIANLVKKLHTNFFITICAASDSGGMKVKMFKLAKWICYETKNMDASVYFRKSFHLDKEVKSAILYVCALGLGTYRINGQYVTDDVLGTPFTRYDKRVIYQKYDVTAFVKKGENAIGIHCGNGFYNNNSMVWNDFAAAYRDRVKVISSIKITFTDGSSTEINSDTTWKTEMGSRTYNHMRQGEICDARLRKIEFSKAGYDDTSWKKVKIAASPGGKLEEMDMPPIRVIERRKPVSYSNGIYDFGINTSGWVRIKVSGEAGQKISIKYDETLNENGRLRGHINSFNKKDKLKLCHEDIFICSGAKDEGFAPQFCYHGFRYVKIENAPENIEVTLEVVHTDLKVIGDFSCSDEMLSKIHKCSVNSIRTNFHSIPTDCPHREQNGWTGDAQLSAEAALMNLDMSKAYTKWLHDFKDVQRDSGQLPGIIPTTNWGYNYYCGPAWDCSLFVIPWNLYLFTGNKTLLEDMWDNMCLYMDYFVSMTDGYIADYGLGDWCAPEGDNACPNNVTDTAIYYYCSVLMSKIAKVLNKDDKWSALSPKIKEAWRNRFLNDESTKKYQTYYACAVYMDLLSEDEKKVFADKLAKMIVDNGNKFNCGILGIKYAFTVLSEYGYIDLLYKAVTNPEYPSYAWWINNGATALCESWEMKASNNHHMYSEVDNWMYKYIAGINFTESGVVIRPTKQHFLNEFNARHEDISVLYKDGIYTIETKREVKIVFENKEIYVSNGTYTYSPKN